MITISFIGLDSSVVQYFSKEQSQKLCSLYKIKAEHLNFYAPSCAFFHAGVDQASWNVLMRIHAPKEYQKHEKEVANFLHESLKDFAINQSIEFYYYDISARYEFLNEEYPRFLDEENSVEMLVEEADDEEIFDGNIFEEIED